MEQENIIQKLKEIIMELETGNADPYAELKAAHAEGKVIQSKGEVQNDEWMDCKNPQWVFNFDYRLKPEEPWALPRQLPGFRPLRDGEEWLFEHRWTKEQLPSGKRPLLVGEREEIGDEYLHGAVWKINTLESAIVEPKDMGNQRRTSRPLPILTPQQVAEGWKEWHGGENPVPGKRVSVLGGPDLSCSDTDLSDNMIWGHHIQSKILAYRIIEPKLVPLGPDDVLPGSWIRWKWPNVAGGGLERFCSSVTDIWSHQLNTASYCHTYIAMFEGDYQINRSIPLNGKWDATAWEPCSKPESKEAAQ